MYSVILSPFMQSRLARPCSQGHRHFDLVSITQKREHDLLACFGLLQEDTQILKAGYRLAIYSDDHITADQQLLAVDGDRLEAAPQP